VKAMGEMILVLLCLVCAGCSSQTKGVPSVVDPVVPGATQTAVTARQARVPSAESPPGAETADASGKARTLPPDTSARGSPKDRQGHPRNTADAATTAPIERPRAKATNSPVSDRVDGTATPDAPIGSSGTVIARVDAAGSRESLGGRTHADPVSPEAETAIITRQGSKQETWESKQATMSWRSVVGIAVVIIIVVMVAVAAQKASDGEVIFFSSYLDLFLSHLPFIALALLWVATPREDRNNAILSWAVPCAFVSAVIYNYVKAFADNWHTKVLALCVGTGRMTLGYLLSAVILIGLLGLARPRGEKERTDEWIAGKAIHGVILAGAVALLRCLVGRDR